MLLRPMLIIVFLLLSPTVKAQPLTCKNFFLNALYPDSRMQTLAQQALFISQKLATTRPSVFNVNERLQEMDLRKVYRRMVAQTGLPPSHPGALMLDPYFYPEFFWETTVSIRVGALQTRTPIISQAERNALRFEWTSEGVIHSLTGQLITSSISGDFVIGLDGQIYISYARENIPNFFRHSSFFAGAPVLFAGGITVEPNGLISAFDRDSGHYKPSRAHFDWALAYLRSRGFTTLDDYHDIFQ